MPARLAGLGTAGDDGAVRLLPRLALEPPPAYVAFVATHLEPLRRDAATALGEEDGDRLYPEVLADIAVHWRGLMLLRLLPGRHAAAEDYLRRVLARRIHRLRWARTTAEEPDEGGPLIEFVGWRPDRPPVFSSGASRLAPYLKPTPRAESGALAEATVAWWHAYETHRRHRFIALCVVLFLLTVLLTQLASATR